MIQMHDSHAQCMRLESSEPNNHFLRSSKDLGIPQVKTATGGKCVIYIEDNSYLVWLARILKI